MREGERSSLNEQAREEAKGEEYESTEIGGRSGREKREQSIHDSRDHNFITKGISGHITSLMSIMSR